MKWFSTINLVWNGHFHIENCPSSKPSIVSARPWQISDLVVVQNLLAWSWRGWGWQFLWCQLLSHVTDRRAIKTWLLSQWPERQWFPCSSYFPRSIIVSFREEPRRIGEECSFCSIDQCSLAGYHHWWTLVLLFLTINQCLLVLIWYYP